jgi:hypothetical protein
MVRTWILTVGLIVLWASVCPGMEGYSEPAPSEVGPSEAVQPVPGDVSVPDGGDQVIESKPDVGYGVSEPGSEGGYEVIDSRPVEDYVVGEPKSEDGYGATDPGRDGEVTVTMVPEDGSEVPGSEPDGNPEIVYMTGGDDLTPPSEINVILGGIASQGGSETAAALTSGHFVTSLGILEWTTEWATMSVQTPASWGVPSLAQVGSNVGLGLAAQMPAPTPGVPTPSDIAGQFNSARSQVSGRAGETLGALQFPQIPDFMGNQ